ncbi:MAG TPA: hypothetical protein VI977_00170 [archaeon]|nr:hypothetical protein [archaeon]
MNSKGQAALEYLMTYGWALVIIVIVAGILFFIAVTPQAGVICTSSDPVKIVLKTSNIGAGTAAATPAVPNSIDLQNGTGGSISNVGVVGADGSVFSATGEALCSSGTTVCTADTNMATVSGGAEMFLYPEYAATKVSGDPVVSATYTLRYLDQFNYPKIATITCSGKVV